MNWLKIIFISIIPILIIVAVIFFFSKKPQKNVSVDQNTFQSQLEYALKTADINPDKIEKLDFQNQVILYLNNTKIILSTQKDPVWQIASLQQVLKTAKIKTNNIKLIDLSINHPYATFENN
jgi:hypothetical protein